MIAKWTISIYLQASEAFYLCIEILGHVTWSGACAVEAEIAGAPPRADVTHYSQSVICVTGRYFK